MKRIRSLPLPTTNCQVVSIKGNVPHFVRMGNLHLRVWFEKVENLTVDRLFETSLIDDVPFIIAMRAKNRPVAFSTSGDFTDAEKSPEIVSETEEAGIHKIAEGDTRTEDHYLYRVSSHNNRLFAVSCSA